jgi:AcrR family transcriptional regulator
MESKLSSVALVRDRRVRRSRSALMRAAVALVTDRGTATVPITDIADAADVSRQVVYQQFGDRDTLLLEAVLDLVRRELLPHIADDSDASTGRDRALATARHFAEHRRFYRAMLTGSCAFAVNNGVMGLLLPVNRDVVHQISGERLDPQTVEDLAAYLTGGGSAFFNAWVVEGDEPLDPEEFTDRLMRMMSVLTERLGEHT